MQIYKHLIHEFYHHSTLTLLIPQYVTFIFFSVFMEGAFCTFFLVIIHMPPQSVQLCLFYMNLR